MLAQRTLPEKDANLEKHGLRTIAELLWANLRLWLNAVVAAHGDEHMTEKRTVIVDGVEFEVELTAKDDGSWDAVVEGKTFNIEVPNAQAAPRALAVPGGEDAAGGRRRRGRCGVAADAVVAANDRGRGGGAAVSACTKKLCRANYYYTLVSSTLSNCTF